MANRLLLVRHAQVVTRYAGRYLGRTDAPLSAAGRRQGDALAGALSGKRFDKLLCSPMVRAVATARPLARATGLTPLLQDDLREMDFGDWEAKNYKEVMAAYPGAFDELARSPMKFRFPGGGNYGEFVTRMRGLARRLVADAAGDIVVVTHGGVIRTLLCLFLGLRPRDYMRFQIDYASLTAVSLYDGDAVLTQLNDVCHLKH